MRPPFTDRLAENATGIAATAVTGTWLAALLLGFSWWLAFMLFGYIVIVPVVAMLFDEDDEEADEGDPERSRSGTRVERDADTDASDALARLRTRYASGELTDEQFERKLDRLLETETIDDAAEWAERNRADGDAARDDEVETDRERGR
ncbi:SHOCT domain-containing protein [Halorubrum sp. DTA46]|uniref:SHOCT domain-containing protein n=1 Tax=Halorubrum sp. DTA46 TaxID=3402162 RepID=UPI003AADF5A9